MGRIADLKRKGVERSSRLLAGEKSILEMIALGRPLREMLEALAHTIEEQSEGLICSILLLDEEGKRLRHGAAPSLDASFHHAMAGIDIGPRTTPCGTAAHSGERVIVSDIATDPA